MKKTFFIIILLLITSASIAISSVDEIFANAVEDFEAKEYQTALDNFLKLENEGYQNADLYYNTGNCFYRLDNLGYAILYYKKALKVDSSHKQATRDLEFLLSITKDKQELEDTDLISGLWEKLLNSLNLNLLAVILLVFLLVLILVINLTIYNYRGREKTLPYFLIAVIIFFIVFTVVVTTIKFQQLNNENEAVLTATSAIGYSGPGTDFTRVFTIHEGMLLSVEKSEDGWSLIKLMNGLGGWIETNTFVRVTLD